MFKAKVGWNPTTYNFVCENELKIGRTLNGFAHFKAMAKLIYKKNNKMKIECAYIMGKITLFDSF